MDDPHSLPTTLLVTNDFPPRVGGIQTFMEGLWRSLPPERVAVLAPSWPGASRYDRQAPFRVVRDRERFMWPGSSLRAKVDGLVREMDARVVLFGDAFPLARLGPELASRGIAYLVMAHGFDYWLSTVPGAAAWLRRVTRSAARVPVCSAFVGRTVRTAVAADVPVSVLTPGVDVERFRPGLPTRDIRQRLGLEGRPLVVCVSRLVARKGQDVLIRAMRRIRHRVPDATLLLVGSGPAEPRLRRLAREAPSGSVRFAGEVPAHELPRYHAVGDVFAMPCRDRMGGLEVEGWGIVFIEAAACGRPVVVGDSGGAKETLIDGETGYLVDGADVAEVADTVARLLEDAMRARQMGKAGRAWVEERHTWGSSASLLADWIRRAAGYPSGRWRTWERPSTSAAAPTARPWWRRTRRGADSASRPSSVPPNGQRAHRPRSRPPTAPATRRPGHASCAGSATRSKPTRAPRAAPRSHR